MKITVMAPSEPRGQHEDRMRDDPQYRDAALEPPGGAKRYAEWLYGARARTLGRSGGS